MSLAGQQVLTYIAQLQPDFAASLAISLQPTGMPAISQIA